MKLSIKNWFKKPKNHEPVEFIKDGKVVRCMRCTGKNVGNTHGNYSRGYNTLCQQASGDKGAYCNDCGYITFITSFEDYKKTLPSWVTPYGY